MISFTDLDFSASPKVYEYDIALKQGTVSPTFAFRSTSPG